MFCVRGRHRRARSRQSKRTVGAVDSAQSCEVQSADAAEELHGERHCCKGSGISVISRLNHQTSLFDRLRQQLRGASRLEVAVAYTRATGTDRLLGLVARPSAWRSPGASTGPRRPSGSSASSAPTPRSSSSITEGYAISTRWSLGGLRRPGRSRPPNDVTRARTMQIGSRSPMRTSSRDCSALPGNSGWPEVPVCRVGPAPCGAGPPSEPDVPVSEHPAQASPGGWRVVVAVGGG